MKSTAILSTVQPTCQPDPDTIKESEYNTPLCVDLDGTLIKGDLIEECFLNGLVANPPRAIAALASLRKGRAELKHKLAAEFSCEVSQLAYDNQLIAYLKDQKARGRYIAMVTAADAGLAKDVADYLGCFDEVLATSNGTNLKGEAKAQALVERFGEKQFVYVADSHCDLPVWKRAAKAMLVRASQRVEVRARNIVEVEKVFDSRASRAAALVKTMRPYQWVKNVLVFVPIASAQSLSSAPLLTNTIIVFLAFSLAASGSYIINDLYDLKSDRNHPRKCNRPFAGGDLPLRFGLVGPVLIMLGVLLAALVSPASAGVVMFYVTVTTGYSYWLKKKPLVDVFVLAVLYTTRIAGGAAACGIILSSWLIAFSGFTFLALAIIKRIAELRDPSTWTAMVERRGYAPEDMACIQSMGIVSSFIASVVLALYIEAVEPTAQYVAPIMLWLAVPLFLFWHCRLWLAAARGQMSDDPILYAAKDRVSQICVILMGVAFCAASIGVPVE